MVGDELDHRGDVLRRSSSAWATYANAFRRISFARFSSRTSRSSSFNRSRSLVVRPGRCPASRCACRTHVRRVSAVQPSFGATDCSTAHSEAWASRCSSTIRTARSRTSGENRLGRPIDPILPSNEVSEKPGTVQIFGLTQQLRRSAVSVPANVAEGFKKRGKNDKARFFNIAQGSLEETRYYLILATALGYLQHHDLFEHVEEVGRLLGAFSRNILTC